MSAEQLEPGTLLNDRYRILRIIGKGGMGTVYQAEHVRLDTILAVKEVRAPLTTDADSQAMLEQCQHEARFLVKLHHPNLPQVTDAFLEDNRFFVVMEYIEGVTLEAKARLAGPSGLPVGTVIEWGLQIADVLAYLHSQEPPIIFRDLKPANVMIQEDGRIRLIDFGIARRFQPGAVKDTNLLGSVGYSPPEQFGRHQTDTRTDIYAFGATLHNLLTGQDPAHSPFKFTSPAALNPAVPERLSRLIDCCLRLDADARPQSIHEVAMELLAIRDSLPADSNVLPDHQPQDAPMAAHGAGSAKIILTNPTLRGSGKTGRGSQRVGSQPVNSGGLGSARLGAPSGPTSGAARSAEHPGGGASGAIVIPPTRRSPSPTVWIAGIAAVLALGAAAAWMVNAQTKHPTTARGSGVGVSQPHTTPVAAGDRPAGDAPPQPPANPPAATPNDSGSAPLTTLNRAVSFDSVAVKGVTTDPQGRPILRIVASGAAQGQPGDQLLVAAFFYDMQNSQVSSQLPESPYTSKDGKLSVAATLSLTTARQNFELPLDLPIAAFPTDITGGLQFHCVAFYGDQRIGESKTYTPLPTEVLSPGTGATSQNPSGGPPSSGPGQPANPSGPRPGTFGTHRGKSDE